MSPAIWKDERLKLFFSLKNFMWEFVCVRALKNNYIYFDLQMSQYWLIILLSQKHSLSKCFRYIEAIWVFAVLGFYSVWQA